MKAVVALPLVLCALFLCAPASAQEPPARYLQLLTEGDELRHSGDLEAARRHYLEAHTLFPNARSLYHLGVVEFDLQHWPQSYAWFRQALASQVRPLDAAARQRASQAVGHARTYIGLFSIAGLPTNAEVEVDNGQPLRDGGELVLAQGPHTLTVRAEGYQAVERVLHVTEGESRALPVTMQRIVVTPAIVAVEPPREVPVVEPTRVAPVAASHTTPAHSSSDAFFIAGGVTLVVGVVGLGLGAYANIQGNTRRADYQTALNAGICPNLDGDGRVPSTAPQSCRDAENDWRTLEPLQYAGLIGGGLVSAVGAVLLIVGATSPSTNSSSSTRLRCGSFADLGLSCEGSF